GRIRQGFRETGCIDYLALDPCPVRLAGDGCYDQTEQAKAVIGIFEARGGVDNGWCLEIVQQLVDTKEWPASGELAVVGAIANDAGAMRQDLAQGCARDSRVQAIDIKAGSVVEPELALFTQLQNAGCGEALRVRGDAKAMARCEFGAGCEVRMS